MLPLVVGDDGGGDDDKIQTTASCEIQMAPCLKLLMEKESSLQTWPKCSKKTASRFVCLVTIKQRG